LKTNHLATLIKSSLHTSESAYVRFSENRAKKIVRERGLRGVRVEFLVHPSPASPAANAGWSKLALNTLTELNVLQLLMPPELAQNVAQA
jgi:hypothetical protein